MNELIKKDCAEIVDGRAQALYALKNETIFITGGTGFVGTWLVELITFLNDNYQFNTRLVLLSRNSHNFRAKTPHIAERSDVILIERDVRSALEIPDDVSFVIHAAGNPDNRQHVLDPLRVMEVIVKGTDSILAAASGLTNLKKFLNISSGLVYGAQPLELDRLHEGYIGAPDCNSVMSIYAEAKRYAETTCSAYRSLYKMPIVTARPFAFIGPYQLLDKPWAINNFIRDSLQGETIRILGDGETIRSYMYPSDMAFWLLRILAEGVSGLAYNVGSPHGLTLKQLAEKIASNFTTRPKIVIQNLNEGRAHRSKFVPDVGLAERSLGLKLEVDIDSAISRTISWFRECRVKLQ